MREAHALSILGLAGLAAARWPAVAPARTEEFFRRPSRSSRTAPTARSTGCARTASCSGKSGIAPHSILDPNDQGGERHRRRDQQRGARLAGRQEAAHRVRCPGARRSRRSLCQAHRRHRPEHPRQPGAGEGHQPSPPPPGGTGRSCSSQKGNPDGITSYDDLKGKTVGAIGGSAAEAYLVRIGVADPALQVRGRGAAEPEPGPGQVRRRGRRHLHGVPEGEPEQQHRGADQHRRRRTTSSTAAATATPATASARRTASCASPTRAALAELRGNGFVSAVLKKYGLSDRNLFWFKLNP